MYSQSTEQDDLIKPKLDFSVKGSVGNRRGTALEQVSWNNVERLELAGIYELRDGVGFDTREYTSNKTLLAIDDSSFQEMLFLLP